MQYGALDATNGNPPANLEDLFPVWNDVSTWNLRPLSPNSIRWQQSFGTYSWGHNQPNAGAYVQDNWQVNSDLTLNLGLRWDLAWDWAGQQYDYPPLRRSVPNEFTNVGGEYGLASGDYRHRAVVSGIWNLPYDFQASTLIIYRSGARSQETWRQDVRRRGTSSGRLRPDGTIIPRNAFVGDPINTLDLKVTRRLPLGGRRVLEGSVEVFNSLNRPTYSYNLDQAAANYMQRTTSGRTRSAQLGLRYRF